MARLLVLGASGFLGAHVVDAARAHDAVEAVLTPGRDELDLTAGPGPLREHLAELDPDAVAVCTGRLDGTVSEFTAAHVEVTASLIDALAGLPDPPRLVRIGSAGEYGPVPHGESVREDAPTWPVNAYGASHLAATHLVRVAALNGALEGTTLRVFNPIGAGGRGTNLAWQSATRIRDAVADGRPRISTAPLTTWRDFVDARDVGRAVVAAAMAPEVPPPVINVGSGVAVQAREVVTTLARLGGYTGAIDEDAVAPARSAGVTWTRADIGLAERALDWRPRHALADALAAVWDTAAP